MIEAEKTLFKDVSELVCTCLGTKSSNLKEFQKGNNLPARILIRVSEFDRIKHVYAEENDQIIQENSNLLNELLSTFKKFNKKVD